jgi:hypothetical protein
MFCVEDENPSCDEETRPFVLHSWIHRELERKKEFFHSFPAK